jgi:hypothetical protein
MIAGNDEKISGEVFQSGKGVSFFPDLQEHVLDDLFGKFSGTGNGKYKRSQLLMVFVKNGSESALVISRYCIEQACIFQRL